MDLSSPANLLLAGTYFLIVAGLVFFSLFAVYVLIRYGKSRLVGLAASLLFGLFFLKILFDSFASLKLLLT